jgi:hypothetical protein
MQLQCAKNARRIWDARRVSYVLYFQLRKIELIMFVEKCLFVIPNFYFTKQVLLLGSQVVKFDRAYFCVKTTNPLYTKF